jgi:hypothetical protein
MSASLRTIIDLNIKRYRKLLETETNHTKRETIIRLLAEEEAKLRSMGQWGDNGQEPPDTQSCVDRRGTRPNAGDLKAVRTGIGGALRALHSLREEVPDRIAELLRQVDKQKDTDRG